MDNIIIASIIGAAATLIAAFIARGYVASQALRPSRKIGSFTSWLMSIFSSPEIPNGRRYVVKKHHSIIDDLTNTTFGYIYKARGEKDIQVSISISGETTRKRIVYTGYVENFSFEDQRYKLSIIYFDMSKCIIDIRKISAID